MDGGRPQRGRGRSKHRHTGQGRGGGPFSGGRGRGRGRGRNWNSQKWKNRSEHHHKQKETPVNAGGGTEAGNAPAAVVAGVVTPPPNTLPAAPPVAAAAPAAKKARVGDASLGTGVVGEAPAPAPAAGVAIPEAHADPESMEVDVSDGEVAAVDMEGAPAPAPVDLSPEVLAALATALQPHFETYGVLSAPSIRFLLKRDKDIHPDLKNVDLRPLQNALKAMPQYYCFRDVWVRREAGPPERRALRRLMLDLLQQEDKKNLKGAEITLTEIHWHAGFKRIPFDDVSCARIAKELCQPWTGGWKLKDGNFELRHLLFSK